MRRETGSNDWPNCSWSPSRRKAVPMGDRDRPGKKASATPLLERDDLKPEERVRIGRAAAVLLGWGLVASTVLALLALWHLIRRGRILRANLAPPKNVSLPEIDAQSGPPPSP